MSEKETTDKKIRNNYSFSIRKTDNPIIGEFIKKQTNYSESLRYLIIKFCRENGVQDISYKLNELVYLPDYPTNFEINNDVNNVDIDKKEEDAASKGILQESIKQEVEEKVNSEPILKVEDHEDDKYNDDDIPECYR